MKQINVVGAVIASGDEVLCVQRGPHGALPGMWEFPGGKIEPGETREAALQREVREELRCEITVGDKVTTTSHDYDFGTVILTTFMCELVEGEPELTEHAEMHWRSIDDLHLLDWAPADIPTVALLQLQSIVGPLDLRT